MNIITENAKRIAGADKRLGQNFILDVNITRKIVNFAHVQSNNRVLEIGPGPGGLTLAILEKQPKELVIIEKDKRCLPGLEDLVELYKGRCEVEIINDDALKVLTHNINQPVTIIANLPYNVASPLLIQFVHLHAHIEEMVLMFQKEVALRIVAKPGSKAYGRLSIVTQAFFKPEIVYHLPPSVFTPPPKVDSAVVRFASIPNPPEGANVISSLEHITQIFFSSRRKTVGNISKKYFSQNLGIQEFLKPYLNMRPENLSVDIYISLAKLFSPVS